MLTASLSKVKQNKQSVPKLLIVPRDDRGIFWESTGNQNA